jgi:hypothetical protein
VCFVTKERLHLDLREGGTAVGIGALGR